MRRILALVFSLQLSVISLLATDITPQEALDIANSFVQHDQTAQQALRKAPKGTKIAPSIAHRMPSRVAQNKDNVYIINLGDNQGFVVVSGESGTVSEILGYCDHGSFNYEDAPVQLQDLLNEYSASIDSLRNKPSLARQQAPARVKANYPSYIGDMVVEPLLTTTWNQTAPYNNQCPSGDNGHCYTGCVPTAVAQVMRYWKWPATYDWDNMLDYYGWSPVSDEYIRYNQTQVDAVAKLMADIGQAMGTSYCQANGSPTQWSYDALVQTFGYGQGINIVRGDKAANVMSTLKAELDAKRPVLYSGNPEQGDGHALVCDGYTANNYFHFNYGWGGQTDGFYRLSAVPMYINNVVVWTNVRPYDAIQKEIDGIRYGLLPNGTADILNYVNGSYSSQNGVLIIPDSVTDPDTGTRYAVTHICQSSFFRKGKFTKMVLGANIEAIDPISFMYSKFDTLVLSDKMEVIPEQAFAFTDIGHLTIGANVKRIGVRAFYTSDIENIVCKSPRVELERECFTLVAIYGDWVKSIVKLGHRALYGAKIGKSANFENLEVIGDSAFFGATWSGYSTLNFRIGPKVREIAQSAFDGISGSSTPLISMDPLNPYFAKDWEPIIYNKDTTSVHLLLSYGHMLKQSKVIKMEPGCVRGMQYIKIPPTVVDMEGAFKDCLPPKSYCEIWCPHMVPPVISDASIPDTLFSKGAANIYLKVPAGTEQLYAEAPGWRKFSPRISALSASDFKPMPPQDLNYQMKLHGDSLHIAAPIADVSSMRLTEENGEATVTLRVNGRADLKTPVSNIDSIIFVPGFVYEGAEIFEINDSSLTVNAQKCSVTFEPTTFDENAQICVRNSVLLPRPMEGVTGGIGIDISMLSDTGRVHELSGVATISVPFNVPADQSVGAAYFNEQTGEWDPVYMEYDREAGMATIITDHLSYFAFVSVTNESTKGEILEALKEIPQFYLWDQATKKLLDILGSDDPEVQQAIEFKDEMGLWQSIGLDGFYNGVVAVTEPLFNFKPECIDNAVTIMGHIGTALTVLDVIRADLQGDQIAVAAGTLKVIMAQTSGAAAAAVGTPIMAASMSMVAFIGIALEKFGTDMQNAKTDYFRSAYSLYYSMAGYEMLGGRSSYAKDKNGKSKPHGHFRTAKDWYDYFYPVFLETDWDADRLMRYIEQSVRMYCDQFWQEAYDNRQEILEEIGRRGIFQPTTYPNEAVQKQISDELFAELMNGELVSVFAALRNKQITQAHNRLVSKINNMAKLMNKKVGFKITDSSIKEGQPSKFSGYTIGFPVLDGRVSDPDKWRKTIGDDCQVALGWFTTYALVRNLVPFKLTLYNKEGEAVKDFEFEIDGVAEKKTIHIDLATQGVKVENKHLDDLHLTYDPGAVDFAFSGIDAYDMYQNPLLDELVSMNEDNNPYKNQTRWCTEVERFFNNHDFITADPTGNFTIGDDIIGKFDGDSATGTFIINTEYKFFIQTAQQYLNMWNNENSTYVDRLKIVLNGSCKHQIACTYKIKRRQVEEDQYEYDITYTGQGAFDMTARHINNFNKSIDWVTLVTTNECPSLSMSDIGIGTSSDGGDVTLEYKTTLK